MDKEMLEERKSNNKNSLTLKTRSNYYLQITDEMDFFLNSMCIQSLWTLEKI